MVEDTLDPAIPDTWTVINNVESVVDSDDENEVVRDFELIMGGGERMTKTAGQGQGGESTDQPTPSFEEKYILRSDHEAHLGDLKKAYADYRADTQAFLDGSRALKAVAIPGFRHSIDEQGQISLYVTVFNLGPLTWEVRAFEAAQATFRNPNGEWSRSTLHFSLVQKQKGVLVPPTSDVDAWIRIRSTSQLPRKWSGAVELALGDAEITLRHGADEVAIPVLSEEPIRIHRQAP